MSKKKNESKGKTCPANIFRIVDNGVAVNDKYYLDLHCFLRAGISIEEAKDYSRRCNLSLPTEEELDILAANIEDVNHKLRLIGQRDYLLPTDLKEKFWFIGQKNNTGSTKRKVLFIVPID